MIGKINRINFKLKVGSKKGQNRLLRLHLNESSLDLPPYLKHKILDHLKDLDWHRYQEENPELLAKLAKDYRLKPGNVLIGNGSNDLIFNLINTFGQSGLIVLFRPTFSVYSKMAQSLGKRFIEIPINLEKGYEIDLNPRILAEASLIFIDSPNNPGGFTVHPQKLREILDQSQGLVVVDEAYVEFSEASFATWVHRYSNLAIVRTFSKAFRLAGVRFGYLIGQKKVIERLRCSRPPFAVGIFPQIVANVILDNKQVIMKQVEEIKSERTRVFNQLKKSNLFSPLPSLANFLLIKSHRLSNRHIFRKLRDRGILVRIFDLPELRPFFRVTIGTSEENDFFLKALSEIEKEKGYGSSG